MKKFYLTTSFILLVALLLTVAASAAEMFVEKELTPIVSVEAPKGGGSKDINVICDGIFEGTDQDQYDTYNARTEPGEDFIGYTFPKTYTVKGFEFTEGNTFWDGGWFEMGTQRIEVLQNNEWVTLSNVTSDPEYPTGLVQDDFGEGFETFMFSFDPVDCDGIRIAGMAGGQASFISCAEARVLAVVPDDYVVSDPRGEAQAAEEAAKAEARQAAIDEGWISLLYTPATNIAEPKGGGNHDINIINDNAWIDEGAEGVDKQQYDTYIAASEPYEVWYGFEFDGKTYSVSEVDFYEGMQFWDGGFFSDGLHLEALINGAWTAIDADSGYPVSENAEDHEPGGQKFVFSFAPVNCEGIRVIGTAGGEHFFTSVSELRVKGAEATAEEETTESSGFATAADAAAGKAVITDYEFVSGTEGFGGEGAENLFDGETGTKFCTNQFPVEAIAKLDGTYSITGFTMATANDNADYNGRSPNAWTISVSADGESWTELAKGDDTFFEETNFTYYAGEGKADGVSYVKFNAEGTASGTFQVSELTLFGDKAVAPVSSTDEDLDKKAEAPNTFDFGVIAAVAAVASLGGFALMKKKNH